ncbi:MAG: C40 family peptidase [Actinomycetota bacterium]|nr:C40 family peptidase [Actinomycetota bacterium]
MTAAPGVVAGRLSRRRRLALLGVTALALMAAGCFGGGAGGGGSSVNPGAPAAVAFAESQVGTPYCTGGIGPDCYDCSGLTWRAWQHGGLSLPRTSGDQYNAYPKVSLSDLQPGDLVFTSDPTQHVGLYVGGGMMVHATHTGDFVREVAISAPGENITLAVRPG